MRDRLLPLEFKIKQEDPNDSDTVYLIIFSDLSFHSVPDIVSLSSLHKNLIHGNLVYLQFFLFFFLEKLSSLEMEKNQFHVLAVDDNIIDRMVIERILLNSPSPSSSYRVTVVDSGEKALEFLGLIGDDDDDDRRSHNVGRAGVEVNLIMTDYSMPGITGYELLRRIKKPSSHLKDVPVVMMSSENVPSRINMCIEDGADGFFLKPVKQSDVNELIPQLLQINQTTGSA